jgi:hypothetical protein
VNGVFVKADSPIDWTDGGMVDVSPYVSKHKILVISIGDTLLRCTTSRVSRARGAAAQRCGNVPRRVLKVVSMSAS